VNAHHNRLFVRGPNHVDIFELPSGEFCATLDLDVGRWSEDRFLRSPQGAWQALSADGLIATLTPVFGTDDPLGQFVTTLFEARGVEGPIGITAAGDLYFTGLRDFWRLPLAPATRRPPGRFVSQSSEIMGKSRCGRRIIIRVISASPVEGSAERWFFIAVGTSPATTTCSFIGDSRGGLMWRGEACLEPDLEQLPIAPNIRNQFSKIGVLGRDQLILLGKRSQWFAFVPHGKRMQLDPIRPNPEQVHAIQDLKDWRLQSGFGFNLKVAVWSDGSRAVLDARGMLHLRSMRDVPESTLLLGDRQISGWSSDGRIWGQPFFCGDGVPVDDVDAICRELIEAFAEGLPR
jgi:hypothetical protein